MGAVQRAGVEPALSSTSGRCRTVWLTLRRGPPENRTRRSCFIRATRATSPSRSVVRRPRVERGDPAHEGRLWSALLESNQPGLLFPKQAAQLEPERRWFPVHESNVHRRLQSAWKPAVAPPGISRHAASRTLPARRMKAPSFPTSWRLQGPESNRVGQRHRVMSPTCVRCTILAVLPCGLEPQRSTFGESTSVLGRERGGTHGPNRTAATWFRRPGAGSTGVGMGTAYGLRSRLASLRGSRPHQKSNAA